jgi:hypothetical protein
MTAPAPDTQTPSSASADTQTLAAAFSAARQRMAHDAAWQPPEHAQASVLAAFDRLHPQAASADARPRTGGWLQAWLRSVLQSPWGLAATAASIFAVSVLALNVVHVQSERAGAQIAASATQMAQNLANYASSSGFVPLVSQTELAQDPAGWLVPAEMPRAQLAALGLPFDPSRADESVRAELLVNAQGAVLAVRVVQ